MNKIPVWIDCDPGVDDSVALLTALSLKQLEVIGTSAVSGNVYLEHTFPNLRNILNLANRSDIKAYKGANKPLIIQKENACMVHGTNGLGEVVLKESDAKVEEDNAWDGLYKTLKASKEKVILITLGPLTNVAKAIIKYPEIGEYIKEINMMGGSLIGGNHGVCSEFNIAIDPQAAQTVFKSSIRVNMFGLDVTHKIYLNKDEIIRIGSYNNKLSSFFKESLKVPMAFYQSKGLKAFYPHDVCPVIYTAYPELFEGKECGIYVETQGRLTMGKTVSDLWTDFKFDDRHCKAFLDGKREEIVSIIENAYK